MLQDHHSHVRDHMSSLQTNGRKPRGEETFSVNLFREVKRDNITSRIAWLFQ